MEIKVPILTPVSLIQRVGLFGKNVLLRTGLQERKTQVSPTARNKLWSSED